jgi:hypothetical protein
MAPSIIYVARQGAYTEGEQVLQAGGATTLSITTFSTMTLSIYGLFARFRIFRIPTLSITTLCHYAECRIFYCYAECRYAERHYAECRYAERHYAECRSTTEVAPSIIPIDI